MDSRHLIAYTLIALIISAPFLFLLCRRVLRRRALRAANKPVHIKR